MKEIIYLDTGLLHSYIAQYNHGLPNSSSHEQVQEINDTNEQEEGYHSRSSVTAMFNTGKFEIPLLFSTPEGQIEGVFQPGNIAREKAIMSQTESGKEIISKQLHDNALEEFEGYLANNDLIHEVTDENIVGNFIKLSDSFKIVDFDYLEKIMQPDKLIKFMFMQQEENIAILKKEIGTAADSKTKSTQRALLKQLENEVKAEKEKQTKNFKYMEETLQYLNVFLPTTSFIKIKQVIAPLKENNLREKANELMFKYGENNMEVKATIIGKVTSKITNVDMPNMENDSLFSLSKILNGILNPLGIIDIGDLIVSPIAIYFE